MKKIAFLAMVCMAMLIASCSGNSVKKVKISSIKNLYSITRNGPDGVPLTGVYKLDGTVVIEPMQVDSFRVSGDGSYIIAYAPSGRTNYTSSGDKKISEGPLAPLKGFPTVFIGKDVSKKTVLYFPEKEDEVIFTERHFLDRFDGVLGYKSEAGFVLRSLRDNYKEYTIPTESLPAYYVRCNGKPAKVVIPGKKSAKVYDVTGNYEKEIKQFDRVLKNGKEDFNLDNIIRVYTVSKPL